MDCVCVSPGVWSWGSKFEYGVAGSDIGLVYLGMVGGSMGGIVGVGGSRDFGVVDMACSPGCDGVGSGNTVVG
jgi:hypothetical protein